MKNILTLLILITILSTSCNSVKRVLKDPAKTQQVVDAYIKQHPVKNDTTILYKEGRVDSIEVKVPYKDSTERVPCDSFTKSTPGGTTITVDSKGKLTVKNDSLKTISTKRVDTLDTKIIDRNLLLEAQDLARRQAAEINVKDQTIKEQKKQIRELQFSYYALWIAIAIVVVIVIVRQFRKP